MERKSYATPAGSSCSDWTAQGRLDSANCTRTLLCAVLVLLFGLRRHAVVVVVVAVTARPNDSIIQGPLNPASLNLAARRGCSRDTQRINDTLVRSIFPALLIAARMTPFQQVDDKIIGTRKEVLGVSSDATWSTSWNINVALFPVQISPD